MATVSKSLKKEIIKNHLLGLDEDENLSRLASSGEHLDQRTLRQVIDEFGSEIEENGLDVAKSYSVSRFANELAEVARFKRRNEIELEDMLRGGRIARVLKNYGVGIPELEQFLSVVYSRAEKKGYDAESIVEQVSALNNLEKKHGGSLDGLKSEFESAAAEIRSKQDEKNRLVQEIDALNKQKSETLAQNKVDELKINEYLLTKERLHELGFDIGSIETVKNFLQTIRTQGFDPGQVISSLNSIGELEKKIGELEKDSDLLESELQKKESLLDETKKLEQSNLSIEQVENIRKTVESISSSRGIDPTLAYTQFIEEILQNYDAIVGLKAVLGRLQESEKRMIAEAESINQQFSAEQAIHSEKIKRLEQEYSKIAVDIESYKALVEMGIDSKNIQSWHQIIEASRLDFAGVEAELKRNASLKEMEREITQKVAGLTSEAMTLKETVEQLTQEKSKIESTIKSLGETAVAELNSMNSTILSSITSLNDGAKSAFSQILEDNEKALKDFRASAQLDTQKAIDDATSGLKTTISQISSSMADFSGELRKTIDEATPQIKSLSVALEAGEKLGKYRNIMPLLQMLDEKNVSESEALITMWNVVSRFNAWISEHYHTSPKPEISETLSKLVAYINDEIQRINQSG